MRITTLIENTTVIDGLFAEHGLSLLLEIGDRKILFDAGQSGRFADNAKRLGIDLREVDTAVLSHGHYDHGNGLVRFLEENHSARLYASRYAFEPHYNKEKRDIGLNSALQDSQRIVYVNEPVDLGNGIMLMTPPSEDDIQPIDHFGLRVLRNGILQPDDFCHEMYLLVQENEKRICITGCAHKGIVNIIRWFDPDVVIGGFHLKSLSPDSEMLQRISNIMAEKNRLYYTGHCTGDEQIDILKHTLGDRVNSMSTGTIIEL